MKKGVNRMPPAAKLTIEVNDMEAANTTAEPGKTINFVASNQFPQQYSIDWDKVKDIQDIITIMKGLNITIFIHDMNKQYQELKDKGFIIPKTN